MADKTGPDDINMDFRIMTLFLAMASRDDLLKDLKDDQSKPDSDQSKWKRLRDIGFPLGMLKENSYLFIGADVEKHLSETQKIMKTLVNLNDYCDFECPSDDTLAVLTAAAQGLKQPLDTPGKAGKYA
jgi:hypothetical protein